MPSDLDFWACVPLRCCTCFRKAIINTARSWISADDSRLVLAGRCFFTVVFLSIFDIYISFDINMTIHEVKLPW